MTRQAAIKTLMAACLVIYADIIADLFRSVVK
jgi:hypothetical protein